MSDERIERRLAAILAADVAGYSRLIGQDEEGTLAALRTMRREVIDPAINEHRGRIVKTTGDGLLAEFQSVIDALRCATAWQARVPADSAIAWRIGIHQGDIVVENGDIFGDGVNVAARLEALAEPGGICVSGRVQEDAFGKLDLALVDLGEQQLRNIARPVRVYAIRSGTESVDAPELRKQPLALPDKPSIAVLPFQNMSGDPEQEYFADGMVEEIITALSRIRSLFVIARNSSFTYKGQSPDVRQVGRELGVRYVLEGSVRKAGGRVRITGQLIDAATGTHLWADRFDGSLADVFEVQDKVASSVAGVIEPMLQAAEMRRSSDRPTNDLTAYDLYLRALVPIRSGEGEKERYLRALDLLAQAIERDPGYAPALATAAFCHQALHNAGWTDDMSAARCEGIDLARRALRVVGSDPVVLGLVARVLGYFGEDLAVATVLMDRALEINPSFALGWEWSGWLRLWAGQSEMAIGQFETSVRLNPLQRRAGTYLGIGVGHFFSQRFDDATAMLLLSLQEAPSWVPTYRFLASCYAHMGRSEEAHDLIRRLRALTTEVIPSALNWRDPEQREFFLWGLRLALGERRPVVSPRS